jgi:hypothetical protein
MDYMEDEVRQSAYYNEIKVNNILPPPGGAGSPFEANLSTHFFSLSI